MPESNFLRAVALAAAVFSSAAVALPATTVSWVQQSGATSPTDPVDIWVRLTVDSAATGPLVIDGTTTSFAPSDLAGFSTIDRVQQQAGTACAGSFFGAGCGDQANAWAFEFNNVPSPEMWLYAAPLTLMPGQSKDFLFGSFTPQNGPVAPGTYRWEYGASLELVVVGTDASGSPYAELFSVGSTCEPFAEHCVFTRTVSAVPEPESYAIFALGLAGIVVRLRQNRR